MATVKIIVRPRATQLGEQGFTLIEAIVALVILMIVIVGVFGAVTYSTLYNTGNAKRSQALSVLQKEVELLRSAKFLPEPTGADSVTNQADGRRDLTGGVKPDRTVIADGNGTSFLVRTTVDDDPFTLLVQTDVTQNLKEITVTVIPAGSRPNSWELGYATTAVFRRVRSN
jgi:type II secretory pathway pseudopilin PulG